MPFGETGSQTTIFIAKWRTSLGDAPGKVKQRISANSAGSTTWPGHGPQSVAAGIPAAWATKPNPRHDLASTSDHPAGSRAIRQPGMAATTAVVPQMRNAGNFALFT